MNDISTILSLAKETLGIVSTATAVDNSLSMIINAGVDDMERAGVNVDLTNALCQNALITYVKANYGISNPIDKEKYLNSYRLSLRELSLSNEYKGVENNA